MVVVPHPQRPGSRRPSARATARRRSLPFTAKLLQFLECLRGSRGRKSATPAPPVETPERSTTVAAGAPADSFSYRQISWFRLEGEETNACRRDTATPPFTGSDIRDSRISISPKYCECCAALVVVHHRQRPGSRRPSGAIRDSRIATFVRATARRRSLRFTAKLLQFLECLRAGVEAENLRRECLQLKRRSARQQQNQDHQPFRFDIGGLVGSDREGKKPMFAAGTRRHRRSLVVIYVIHVYPYRPSIANCCAALVVVHHRQRPGSRAPGGGIRDSRIATVALAPPLAVVPFHSPQSSFNSSNVSAGGEAENLRRERLQLKRRGISAF